MDIGSTLFTTDARSLGAPKKIGLDTISPSAFVAGAEKRGPDIVGTGGVKRLASTGEH